jgi:uncharacterized protein YegL
MEKTVKRRSSHISPVVNWKMKAVASLVVAADTSLVPRRPIAHYTDTKTDLREAHKADGEVGLCRGAQLSADDAFRTVITALMHPRRGSVGKKHDKPPEDDDDPSPIFDEADYLTFPQQEPTFHSWPRVFARLSAAVLLAQIVKLLTILRYLAGLDQTTTFRISNIINVILALLLMLQMCHPQPPKGDSQSQQSPAAQADEQPVRTVSDDGLQLPPTSAAQPTATPCPTPTNAPPSPIADPSVIPVESTPAPPSPGADPGVAPIEPTSAPSSPIIEPSAPPIESTPAPPSPIIEPSAPPIESTPVPSTSPDEPRHPPPAPDGPPPASPTPTSAPSITPAPVSPTPTEVSPTPVNPTPTEVSPTPVSPTPTEVSPTPVSPTPTEVSPTPVSPTPTEVSPTPVSPTPTEVSPTPVSPTPTEVSPTPVSPTPTEPSSTPTPCDPDHRQSLDIQMTIDHSSSMEHFLSSVQQAARIFVSLTDPATDQLGVTAFDKRAETTQQLTYDRSAVLQAIDAITMGSGTNIAAGIEAAQAELMSRRRNPNAVPVLLLMTDGRAPAQPAIAAANAAKAAGIRIVVIAIGNKIEVGTLHAIASPNDLYFAKTPMDIAPMFAVIANSLKHGCDVIPAPTGT